MSFSPRRPAAACLATLSLLALPGARAQAPSTATVSVSPTVHVLHSRLAAGDLNGDGNADLLVSGLVPEIRQPQVRLLRYTTSAITVDRGTTVYSVGYSQSINPFGGAWGGDVLAHDLDGDGDLDVLLTGANDSTSTAKPVAVQALQQGGVLSGSTPSWLPALAQGRLAASGALVAATGRLASGALTLRVLRRTAVGSSAHTAVATGTGMELGTLAFGDCDADGDPDLVSTGLDASGRPVATLLRNTAGAFAESALDVPGVFNGDALLRDLDADGDADLVLTGSAYGPAGTEGVTRVYRAAGCAFAPVALSDDLASFEGRGAGIVDLVGVGPELVFNGQDRGGNAVLLFVPINTLAAPLAVRQRDAGALNGDLVVYDYDRDGVSEVLTVGTRVQSVPADGSTILVPSVVLVRRPVSGG